MEPIFRKTLVKVEDDEWKKVFPAAVICCRRAAAAVLESEGLENSDFEISVVLTNNKMIRKLNLEWRGVDAATDVLAFPNQETSSVAELPQLLGDVVVAFGVASRDAKLDNVSLRNHLSHLIVHGVFHLLGFDHLREADAKIMEARETRVLAELGVGNPYAGKPLNSSLTGIN